MLGVADSQTLEFKHRRPVLWLIGSCVLLALVAALIFAVIVAGASVALASHQSSDEMRQSQGQYQQSLPATPAEPAGTAFRGMITDSHCGARHMRSSHLSSAECARSCVRKGASYVLVDGDRRYTLVGAEEDLARVAGTRASVMGTRQGSTILVSSTATGF